MANLKASKKYIPINKRNRQRNVAFKSNLKTRIKQALEAISSDSANKIEVVRLALKTIAKVRQKGIIHKNYANRMKSKLSIKLQEAGTTTEPKEVEKKTTTIKAAAKTTTKKTTATTKKTTKAATTAKKTTTKKTTSKKTETSKKAEVKEDKKD